VTTVVRAKAVEVPVMDLVRSMEWVAGGSMDIILTLDLIIKDIPLIS
jgi:hypothetical protein